MQRILLVEDCAEIQIMVKGALGNCFKLTTVASVSDAMGAISNQSFDLFLIDIVLPDGDGFQLCADLRNYDKTKNTPVFFLTAKSETKDKVMGFSLGADDYVVKPFDPLELRARVESKLRKVIESKVNEESLWSGELRLDMPYQKAFSIRNAEEKDLNLTPNEFKLLYYFIRHEEHVLSRSQLLDAVWGNDLNVIDRTVDTHVCTLRKKLHSKSYYIRSVFGEGYKFSLSDSPDEGPNTAL